jgi:hypothetical protein
LLFLALILRMLQPGGRAAVIVPDGVLFGSTKSHREIRKTLVEKHGGGFPPGVLNLTRVFPPPFCSSPKPTAAGRMTYGFMICRLMASRWTISVRH